MSTVTTLIATPATTTVLLVTGPSAAVADSPCPRAHQQKMSITKPTDQGRVDLK